MLIYHGCSDSVALLFINRVAGWSLMSWQLLQLIDTDHHGLLLTVFLFVSAQPASTTGAQVVHAQQRAVAAAAPAEVVAIAAGQGVRAVTPVTASAVVSTTLSPVQSQTRPMVTQVTPGTLVIRTLVAAPDRHVVQPEYQGWNKACKQKQQQKASLWYSNGTGSLSQRLTPTLVASSSHLHSFEI